MRGPARRVLRPGREELADHRRPAASETARVPRRSDRAARIEKCRDGAPEGERAGSCLRELRKLERARRAPPSHRRTNTVCAFRRSVPLTLNEGRTDTLKTRT